MLFAHRDALLHDWEVFALPLVSREAAGGGTMPDRGSLLDVQGAEVSSVRRVDGRVEVRIWNPSLEDRRARVDGRELTLGPAEIRTLDLEGR